MLMVAIHSCHFLLQKQARNHEHILPSTKMWKKRPMAGTQFNVPTNIKQVMMKSNLPLLAVPLSLDIVNLPPFPWWFAGFQRCMNVHFLVHHIPTYVSCQAVTASVDAQKSLVFVVVYFYLDVGGTGNLLLLIQMINRLKALISRATDRLDNLLS